MKKKIEKVLAGSLGVLGFAAPIGLGIWHVLRGKRPAEAAQRSWPELPSSNNTAEKPQPATDHQKLESLALNTPGEAPLDRIARIAAWEARVEEDGDRHADVKTPEPPGSDHPGAPEETSVAGLLDYQSLAGYRLEGWSVPEPKRLPIPTYAPAVMAFGIVIFAMGLATVWYVCIAGSLVFAVAACRWVGELQGE